MLIDEASFNALQLRQIAGHAGTSPVPLA